MNNLTAEEHLERMFKCKRNMRNALADMRVYQAERDAAEDKLRNSQKIYEENKMELETTKEIIDEMPTDDYRAIVKLHYDEDRTWEYVSEAINYSTSQIYKFRPRALDEFQETWNKNQKI